MYVVVVFLLYITKPFANEYKAELFDENNGFSSSIIFSIVQDKDGFLWFGTAYNGVMRYDGKNIVRYQHDPNDKSSLPHNNAGNLTLDKDNNLWIGSWGGGVSRFDQKSHVFTQYQFDSSQNNSISQTKIQNIFEDQQGDIWLGTAGNGLNKFNREQQNFTRFAHSIMPTSPVSVGTSHGRIWDIVQTNPDTLWIGTHSGLNRFDKTNNTFHTFMPALGQKKSGHSKIRHLLVGEDHTLLMGTDDGVLIFDLQTQSFTALDNQDHGSIGPIYSMIKTSFNEYWISSNRGVFSFTANDLTLKKVDLGFNDQCSQTLFEDRQGIIWLTCEGVGVYKITKQDRFKLFAHPLVKSAYSLLATHDDNILIGTAQHGIQKWNPSSKQLIPLDANPDNVEQPLIRQMAQTSQGDIWFINSKSVFMLNKAGKRQQVFAPSTLAGAEFFKDFWEITIDHQDNVWIGTANGVFVIRHAGGLFDYISPSKDASYSSDRNAIMELYQDNQKRMWFGTTEGLFLWNDKTKKAKYFKVSDNEESVLRENGIVYSIYQDSQQRLWISTAKGLYLLDEKTAKMTLVSDYFLELKSLGIRFIQEDNLGSLWLVTPIGVSKFDPDTGQIQHFDKTDGLARTRYFIYLVAQTSDGTIFLSSRDGVHYFDPSKIPDTQLSAKTLLTNFEVLGTPQKSQISNVGNTHIDLGYDENYLKFEYATLDLLNAQQIRYNYKLEGFDTRWIQNGTNNTAVYTNLNGGDYVFKVRATIKNDLKYEHELFVGVHIATPFWQQWWMFIFYAALAILSIVYYIQRQKNSVIKLEKQVAEKTASIELKSRKLEAANKVKSQFLANMSHEIRTPLTTVIGQAEAIICRDIDSNDIYKEVEVIHDSGLYLLELLNDILDLTKIEENKFELELHSHNLHELLENINRMFSIQAKSKGLSFRLTKHLPEPFIVNIDSLRVKQILINLCSNAIKFTPDGYVALDVVVNDNQLTFTITDTGIGMDPQQTKQVFESFTQADASISRRFGGTGLGLFLSSGLAELMNGNITVHSQLTHGSEFTFLMPIEILHSSDNLVTKTSGYEFSVSENLFSGKILLAEDHRDNRRLIARLLTKLGLTVYTAIDGLDAIELCLKHTPDIIFLDIQMPKMDGIQAYKTLREQGCFQPIIALTANVMAHEVEQYLTLGFNGHLSKPLNRKDLITTIAEYLPRQTLATNNEAEKALSSVDMSDLVTQFKVSLGNEKKQFTLHASNQDMQSIVNQTHRLIGASQLFGFTKLAEVTLELEMCVKHNNIENFHTSLQNLLDEITYTQQLTSAMPS